MKIKELTKRWQPLTKKKKMFTKKKRKKRNGNETSNNSKKINISKLQIHFVALFEAL